MINNYDVYNKRMDKSFQDKLFFLDKIKDNIEAIVDFGCADGALIRHLSELTNIKLVGYDSDYNMIDIARTKTNNDNCLFNEDFGEIIEEEIIPQESLLNISSVIHEVYSYLDSKDIEIFWDMVFDSNFKYISIRDLCASESINRPSNINDYTKLIQRAKPSFLSDFESVWGSVRENRNLVHYLLKYRFLENWDREVRENYFGLSLERLLSKIPMDKYEIIYFENYILPYTANKIKEDFDIELHDNTHVKLLLKKRDLK